jgi:hypothetical protein
MSTLPDDQQLPDALGLIQSDSGSSDLGRGPEKPHPAEEESGFRPESTTPEAEEE